VDSDRLDADILHHLKLDHKIFGKIVPPATRLGNARKEFFAGQPPEIIAVCGHDTASAVAAIPATEEDYVFISTGTWCILGIESDKAILTERARRLGFTNERAYGNRYRVLKNIVGLWLIQGIQKALPGQPDFSELEKMAAEAGTSAHIVNPDDELFYHPENMLEAFDCYFRKTSQTKPQSVGGYLQCAYRSLALSFAYYIRELEEITGNSYKTIHLIGGGSQSGYLCQSSADFTLRKIVSGPVEAASIGNVLVQAIAMGAIADIQEGRNMVRDSFPIRKYFPGMDKTSISGLFGNFISLKEKE